MSKKWHVEEECFWDIWSQSSKKTGNESTILQKFFSIFLNVEIKYLRNFPLQYVTFLTLPYSKKHVFFESVEKIGVAIEKMADDVVTQKQD